MAEIVSLPVLPKCKKTGLGRFCEVLYGRALEKLLADLYGRSGLCLKVLRYPGDVWEGRALVDAIRVQNLGAMRGIAPRVYAIARLKDSNLAQVTDWKPVEGEPTPAAVGALCRMIYELGVGTTKLVCKGGRPKWDIVTSVKNWSNDLFLDWGGYYLRDPESYVESLRKRLMVEVAPSRRGKGVKVAYQSMPELNIAGKRDTAHRIAAMGLEEIDFAGKTVLDLGCGQGAMTFYADDRGARRVAGIDIPLIASPMREAANWLMHWNIAIIGAYLPQEVDWIESVTGIAKFDIVLALSICNHIGGYDRWIADLCADTLILEGHGGDKPERYADDLARDFAAVTLAGYTTDQMRRPVFVCRKE